MCTVTYLPKGKSNFILTSNRDENPNRNTISPQKYMVDGVALTFPKDEVAGGTWIGVSEKNRLICLLNGGFEIHERKVRYRMSRGIIVKMLLTSNDAVAEIKNFDFNNIEPFTIVLVDWNTELETYELVWDGNTKHFKKLAQEPHIWSSSTLYNKEMKQLRRDWFANWLKVQYDFQQEEILKFHKDETKGNEEISVKIKRSYVETISTTCVEKTSEVITMSYEDYTTAEDFSEIILDKKQTI